MKRLPLAASLLVAGAAWGSYTFYQTDSFTTIDLTKWSQTGNLVGAASGLMGNYSGTLISKVGSPTGNDYDVRMTIHTTNPYNACWSGFRLYVRSSPDASTAYYLSTGPSGPWGFTLNKRIAGFSTTLAAYPFACHDGMVLRMAVRGNQMIVWDGPYAYTYTDNDIPSGQPGVGITSYSYPSDSITSVQIGPIDTVPPLPITQSGIVSTASAQRVDLQWPAGSDDPNGIGIAGYTVTRDGIALGTTQTPLWADETVLPGTSPTYSLKAYDWHGNYSTPTTYLATVPATTQAGSVEQRRVGVRPSGAYWGAAGEQIDLNSGNLNFSVPLLKALGRGGWGVTFALSYNSQMWRSGGGGTWLLGEDLGEGLGWKLQAGSIRPVWFNGSIHHYVYSDATGAEYRLDQNNSGQWTSLDATYVAFNANNGNLYFPDGSFWQMGVTSSTYEQDAGTYYPSTMEDTNGNQLS